MKSDLKGIVAAPFTGLREDGSLNLSLIPRQVKALINSGVQGAFVCGTTGEGASLTSEERLEVAERWVAAARGQLKVIVHVGQNSVGESRKLAAHAAQIGAHAIASIGSTFFRPPTTQQLVEFCAQIASAAPRLPFYYYHFPAMTGVNLPMIEFLQAGAKRIPNLAGLKFTDENLMSLAQCVQLDRGRFNILFGRDESLLAGLALGASGAVGSTYNFMAPVYHRLIEAFKAGDLETARLWQKRSIDIIAVMTKHGGLPAGKAMMKLVGLDCGPVRPPLRNLTSREFKALQGDLARAGFPAGLPKPSGHDREVWSAAPETD